MGPLLVGELLADGKEVRSQRLPSCVLATYVTLGFFRR